MAICDAMRLLFAVAELVERHPQCPQTMSGPLGFYVPRSWTDQQRMEGSPSYLRHEAGSRKKQLTKARGPSTWTDYETVMVTVLSPCDNDSTFIADGMVRHQFI